jgi:hypothetical protein
MQAASFQSAMMARIIASLLALCAASVLCCGSAAAHLLPAQNATMNVIDSAAYFVVSVPASALKGVDDDANGLLSPAEMQRHTALIVSQFEARFHVSDQGKPGGVALSWLAPPQTDGDIADTAYVIILQRVDFASAIKEPVVTTDLFGAGPGEKQMTITATRGATRQVAILEAGARSHTFFRGYIATFVDFIRIGIEHVLTGPDHLLFLLTILLAASRWRYWLGVVTSFTLAHSITLSLSVFDLVRLPPNIVEPGIAASIVFMALVNLRGAGRIATREGWVRIAIVFACGLLHGFGFASAIAAMGVDAESRIAALAGFNIGIETGQFLFVGAVLLLFGILGRLGSAVLAQKLPQLATASAAILGGLLLIQRITAG